MSKWQEGYGKWGVSCNEIDNLNMQCVKFMNSPLAILN